MFARPCSLLGWVGLGWVGGVGQPNPTQHDTTQHDTTQHNTTQHKIFGFVCCHGVDRGGGVLFRSVLGLC